MKSFIILITLLFAQLSFGQDLKIYQLSPILNSQLASNDVTIVSDISAGASKKLSIGELDLRWLNTASSPLLKTGNDFSIPMATSSVPGYLSSADWTMFNAKQPTVSATSPILFSGNVLSIPAASASLAGYLSSADWTTFNSKVGTSTVQVITNKDIDGGTASNTSRITIPKDSKTNLDALTRKAGTLVYDTTTNKPYYDNGTVLSVVGSGSGGSKNYIAGGDAEAGTTGFAAYNNTAGTAPVTGTGGSPSVTFTTNATTPLEGLNSFIFNKGATNRQGDGVGYAFTIDRQDQAKVLQISFNYMVASGTFVSGSSSTASDVTVWIYDVTNSVLIQPSSINLLSNSTTIADKFNATFQTASNSTSYRLIFHVGSTSTSAYSLRMDTLAVSPSTYVYGTPITDWKPYTITITGSTGPTYGTVVYNQAYWRRAGDSMEITYVYYQSTAGTSGTGGYVFNLPPGYTIDGTKININNDPNIAAPVGDLVIFDGSNSWTGTMYAPAANILAGQYSTATASPNTGAGATRGGLGNGSVTYKLNAKVPIVGWSSSVQMSDQTDTRVVVARYSTPSSKAYSPTQPIDFSVKAIDTHSAVTTGTAWKFTVPVAGFYRISASAIPSGNLQSITLFKNGTFYSYLGTQVSANNALIGGTDLLDLKVGEYIDVRGDSSGTTASSLDKILIERVTGPSAISATEDMNARYYNVSQSFPTGLSTISYSQKSYDTHGSWTNGNFYSVQIPGKYFIKCVVEIVAPNSGLSGNVMYIYKNGVAIAQKQYTATYVNTAPYSYEIQDQVQALATDGIYCAWQNGFGTTATGSSNALTSFVNIQRIGN